MKKLLIALLVIALGAGGAAAYKLTRPSFELKSDSLIFEYGDDPAAVNLADRITDLKNLDISDIAIEQNFDINTIGEGSVTYSYKDIVKTLTTTVQDTTAPELTLKAEEFKIIEGGELKIEDVIDTVTDKGEISSREILVEEGACNKPGEYTANVVVTDWCGNKTQKDIKLTVEPKPAPVVSVPAAGDEVTGPRVYNDYGWDVTGIKNQPYLVGVNRACNTVTVYMKDADGNYTVPYKAMTCSVGRSGHETITGRYNTTDRFEWCYMVDGSWGKYAIRIKGGYMFHSVCYYSKSESDLEYDEFNKLGSPASLGCVRLSYSDIYWLYENTPRGFPTIIYDDADNAGPLGKPSAITIDTSNEETRGWDPTNPNKPF